MGDGAKGQAGGGDPHPATAELASCSLTDLRRLLRSGELTSVELVTALADRLEAVDRSGPTIRSVLRLNAKALEEAAGRDAERRSGRAPGPLHGIPVLLKDNIDTAELGTSAGSFVLEDWPPARDAPAVELLRRAGAVVFGKANLSEWANFRGRPSSSGWSAVGGQTLNPHALDRSPGGSSSGSAAAVAAGIAPIAVGTETDGSILCPSSACGVVGLKPTVGLVPIGGIVPISSSQDTAGPIGRSVADVAILLNALLDPVDAGRAGLPPPPWLGKVRRPPDYAAALSKDVSGMRVGVLRLEGYFGYQKATDAVVEVALAALAEAGAKIVEVTEMSSRLHEAEMSVLTTEFKVGMESYLADRASARIAAGHPASKHARTLDDVIEATLSDPRELPELFALDQLEASAGAASAEDAAYLEARARNWRLSRTEGIDAACEAYEVEALAAPTMAFAWPIDHVGGDRHDGCAWSQPAVAGYPSVTLPVGFVKGLPVGMALFGRAYGEATLLNLAFAIESQLSLRTAPSYAPSANLIAQAPPFAS